MKKIALLTLAALLLAGNAFAKSDNGALAGGIVFEAAKDIHGNPTNNPKAGVKFAGLFDIGTNVVGPLFAGFELQGTYRQQDQISATNTQTFIDTYFLGDAAWLNLINSTTTKNEFTYYETDISPRGYLSLDINDNVQALAFLGVSKNINSYDYTVTAVTAQGQYAANDVMETKKGVVVAESPWFVVGGARGTFGMFYVDYTRYLNVDSSGRIDWSQYSRDIVGAGISLRW